jgi:hypothetical protein
LLPGDAREAQLAPLRARVTVLAAAHPLYPGLR